jgi:hypothetical protein
VIEAESQAVLNSLTEHHFQVAFKNGRSAGNGAYVLKRKLWMALCIWENTIKTNLKRNRMAGYGLIHFAEYLSDY